MGDHRGFGRTTTPPPPGQEWSAARALLMLCKRTENLMAASWPKVVAAALLQHGELTQADIDRAMVG